MRSKDILNMLNDEVAKKMPEDKILSDITSTPIAVSHEGKGSAAVAVARPSIFKNKAFVAAIVIVACLAVLAGVIVPIVMRSNGGGDSLLPTGGIYFDSTYLTMDINPSINYVVDKDGKVKNVVSNNNDGDILLSNGFRDSIIGKNVDVAVASTIDQARALGYIDASNVGADGKVNAVRFTASSDNTTKAMDVLASVKNSATAELKSKGIFMVVVDKVVAKENILTGTDITSIEQLSERLESTDAFHYVSSVAGKDEDAIIKAFKEDFLASYIADEFDEALDDVDDNLEYISEILELCDKIFEIEEESEGLIKHPGGNLLPSDRLNGYWYYYEMESIENSDIKAVVDEITDKILEYNDEIAEDSEEIELLDMSSLFEHIDLKDVPTAKLNLLKMKARYDIYIKADIKEKIEGVIEEIEDNITKIDKLIDTLNVVLDKFIDNVESFTAGIRTRIDGMVDKVSAKADEYYNVCKSSIDKTYASLMARHEGNVGSVTVDEYDRMLAEILERYEDLDDFWDDMHPAK